MRSFYLSLFFAFYASYGQAAPIIYTHCGTADIAPQLPAEKRRVCLSLNDENLYLKLGDTDPIRIEKVDNSFSQLGEDEFFNDDIRRRLSEIEFFNDEILYRLGVTEFFKGECQRRRRDMKMGNVKVFFALNWDLLEIKLVIHRVDGKILTTKAQLQPTW